MNTAYGLAEQRRYGQDSYLINLLLVRNGAGIRDDDLFNRTFRNTLNRRTGKYRMGGAGIDLLRPRFLQRSHRVHQRAPGVNLVVYDYRGLAVHLADDIEHLGEVVVAQAQHKMTETPARTKWVCRPVGYDNEHIYLKYLGIGQSRLSSLKKAGII